MFFSIVMTVIATVVGFLIYMFIGNIVFRFLNFLFTIKVSNEKIKTVSIILWPLLLLIPSIAVVQIWWKMFLDMCENIIQISDSILDKILKTKE